MADELGDPFVLGRRPKADELRTPRQYGEAALANIEAHPETWDQRNWRCGSACCFAGHVATVAGYYWTHPEHADSTAVTSGNGRSWDVADVAEYYLGLSIGDGNDAIFDPANTLGDLRKFVAALSDQPLEAPE